MAWSVAHENLLKKMGREWDEYTGSMWNLPGYAVLGKSNEIAAMRFCYNQVAKHIHDYQSEDLEWLLAYEKPLETLCSRWMAEQLVDFDAEFDRVLRDGGYEEEPESGMDMSGLS